MVMASMDSLSIEKDLKQSFHQEGDESVTSGAGDAGPEKLQSSNYKLYSDNYARVGNKQQEGYAFELPSEMRDSKGDEATKEYATANDGDAVGRNDTIGVPDMGQLLPTDTTQATGDRQMSDVHTNGVPTGDVQADGIHTDKVQPVDVQIEESIPLPLSLHLSDPPRRFTDRSSANADPYSDFHNKLVLRDYQEEVAERSLNGQNDIILLPTGAGKTYVAIKVIIKHLYERRESGKPKVVFFVPTAELAIQQLKKIQDYLPFAWHERSRMIIGDCSMPIEQLIRVVTEDEYVVLVVTPAIIANYFNMYKDASLSHFSLFIFDEYHHAKKDHPYNELIRKCLRAKSEVPPAEGSTTPIQLPQMIGMTATIGIGDSSSISAATAYIIGMCAKFGLESPPKECKYLSEGAKAKPDEEYVRLDSRRQDEMSNYLQKELMHVLELKVAEKLASPLFEKHGVSFKASFPEDRYAQTYEHYLVNLRDAVTQFHATEELRTETNYCMVAINHLLAYYRTIQLVNLLYCEHGLKYLEDLATKPEYQGIPEIWELFLKHFSKLQDLALEEDKKGPNRKILSLQDRLEALFTAEDESKVIMFVQMRVVAQYLAELLNKLNPTFRAKEFTSTGPSAEEGGMKPQQRFDAREGFEGSKYNILVATSVLEEGIDIQACNMVIRYMYVKDMIAKIQSRGRARHERGVLVAMLDDKLLNQERKNNFRESLMYQALEDIRALPEDEFRKQITAQMKSLTPKKATTRTWQRNVKRSAKISCKSCGIELGDMNDVRKYGMSHFLILDPTLHEKVQPYPDPSVMKAMDGMVPYGRLNCKGANGKECGCRVGTLMKMDSGLYFGMWYIKGITVNNIPLKKYKDVLDKHAVDIQPVFIDELTEVGSDVSFPQHLLQK